VSLAVWTERLRLAGLAAQRRLWACRRRGLWYVVEGQDWVIRREGLGILGALARQQPGVQARLTDTPRWLHGQVVHFGSLGCLAAGIDWCAADNRVIATVYHGYPGMDAGMQRRMDRFLSHLERIRVVITACSLMVRRLEGWGVPAERIRRIPLGTSVEQFHPVSPEERARLRRRLGIPEGVVVVGSFQKDGVGWGEGEEPKLIKGPDLLVEALARLRRRLPVFALLTGPARGYVKKGLARAGVPFLHHYLEDFAELPRYYQCLDLYLVTSREEGGPKSLPESMASGVPVVTTRCGMAEDMLRHGVNGMLVEVEDLEGLVECAAQVLEDQALRRRLVQAGLETVQDYDWSVLAEAHWRLAYRPLLEEA
jgi:glycosyltransferase involved in cell wall biosynthesis